MVEVAKAFLKRWGTNSWKQRIWDEEYSHGMWARKGSTSGSTSIPRDSVLEVIERYSSGAEILELGCGAGETAFEIADTFQSYVGVDISEVAVSQGIEAARRQASRAGKISFVTGDISDFSSSRSFSVILFRESIYYIPKPKIPGTLQRLASFLTPHGVFIVRVHDRVKFRNILELIGRDYQVAERCLPPNAATATIVFSPRSSEQPGTRL